MEGNSGKSNMTEVTEESFQNAFGPETWIKDRSNNEMTTGLSQEEVPGNFGKDNFS
jgi:hypothetical protein